MKRHIYAVVLLLSTVSLDGGRSIHRPSSAIPEITTQWVGGHEQFRLQHAQLEASAIFDQYDEAYVHDHLLPKDRIGKKLYKLIEHVVSILQNTQHKQHDFEHFTILKQRDYNPKTHAGLIVLRFKKYPFVVKLFMETPSSFVQPFSKGFEPICFFLMGGGINRFLSGFSRVKNREIIAEKVSEHPVWSEKIIIPRKWFWLPKKVRYLQVSSKHMGPQDRTIRLPSVYAIVADAIDASYTLELGNPDHRKLGIDIARFLNPRIDPHINNFMILAPLGSKKAETYHEIMDNPDIKIAIIDTEHFPTMTGLREPLEFDSYFSWYSQITGKCLKDTFLRTKNQREDLQGAAKKSILLC